MGVSHGRFTRPEEGNSFHANMLRIVLPLPWRCCPVRCPFSVRAQAIYVYSGPHAHKRTNTAFLLSAWLLLYGGRTPEQVRFPRPPLVGYSIQSFMYFLAGLTNWKYFLVFNFPSISLDIVVATTWALAIRPSVTYTWYILV